MRSVVPVILLWAAVGAEVLAAPRESASFTAVPSASSVQGSAQPEQGVAERTTTLIGGYTARRLVISGTLTSQIAVGQVNPATPLARQARVLVTPPGGRAPFVLFPFPAAHEYTAISTAVGGVSTDLPDPGYDPVGLWRFRFFQSFQNNPAGQADATWTSVSLSLDDQPLAPPAAASAGIVESVSFTDVASDGVFNSAANPNSVREFTFTGQHEGAPYRTEAVVITGQLRSLQADNAWQSAGLAIRPPGATRDIFVQPFYTSSAQRGVGVMNLDAKVVLTFPAANSAAGTWRVRPFQYVDLAGVQDARWTSLTIGTLAFPANTGPTAIDLGTLTSVATRSGDALAAGGVVWYRFTLAQGATLATHTYLDIDFEGTTLTPSLFGTDMAAALYSADGSPIAINNAGGTDSRALLSFGAGLRAAPGAGALPFGGHSGDLAAGTYLLAVACWSPTLTFAPGFELLGHVSPQHGTVRARLATGAATIVPTPTTTRDMGLITGARTETIPLAAQQPAWIKFVLPGEAGIFGGARWLDIDTRSTTLGAGGNPDTVLALFDAAGRLVLVGEDGGGGLLSLLTFGGSPGRAAIGTGFFRNGAGGNLARGVYYLAAASAGASGPLFGNGFGVLAPASTSGTLVVNFATSLRSCDAADVAGIGGTTGGDGQLTADDVIVFIGALLSGDATIADIAGLGGTAGPDGQVSADDLIAFLAAYFTPCQ